MAPDRPHGHGMSDVDVAVARDQLRDLVARYAVAVDSRDLDSLVELFVDDVQVGRSARGRDAGARAHPLC